MYRLLILLLALSTQLGSQAQIKFPKMERAEVFNLVPNHSFEGTDKEPCGWNQGVGKFDQWMQLWSSPTQTTPDLLSTRVRSTCWSHPSKHSSNRQRPRTGDNMIGMKCYGTGGTETDWHEYIQIELSEALKADSIYTLEFYANVSQRASRIANNIGAVVLTEAIHTRDRKPLYITPTINSEKMIKQGIMGWKKISGTFKASGDEKYLIIGNFYRDEETQSERLETGRDGAYYYIDDVMLRRAEPNEKLSSSPKESRPPAPLVEVEERTSTDEVEIEQVKYKVGTTVELKQIQFDFDQSEILPSSQDELDVLANLMNDHPFMEIEVSGHTDNVGDESYNQKLSEARAQAVVAYLIHKKVEKERLSFVGMGSAAPLASNSTEEGKIANRRVEFRILKN